MLYEVITVDDHPDRVRERDVRLRASIRGDVDLARLPRERWRGRRRHLDDARAEEFASG